MGAGDKCPGLSVPHVSSQRDEETERGGLEEITDHQQNKKSHRLTMLFGKTLLFLRQN